MKDERSTRLADQQPSTRRDGATRERGAIFLFISVLVVLIVALTGAFLSSTRSSHGASIESYETEIAYQMAQSGVAFYLGELADVAYFDDNPAPHAERGLGSGSFTLESATELQQSGLQPSQWQVVVTGRYRDAIYTTRSVIGNAQVEIPKGVVVRGTGSASSTVLTLGAGSLVGSFDPTDGYDRANLNSNGNVGVNGSLQLDGTAGILGNLSASGTMQSGSSSQVSGTVTENGDPVPIADIDPIVQNAYDQSRSSNDNGNLTAIFGAQWVPLAGAENYGDLIVLGGGPYVIPSGTYRFRKLEIRNGTRVTFDTSGGPSQLVYVGAGAGTGAGNDLQVNGSQLLIDPGTTTNSLLTVLGNNCDFKITNGSIFGQAVNDPNNAGYSQIISLGGNASSDDIVSSGGSKVYGRVYATAHALNVAANSTWFGSVLTRTVTLGSNATIAIDEGELGNYLSDPSSYEVLASWPQGSP